MVFNSNFQAIYQVNRYLDALRSKPWMRWMCPTVTTAWHAEPTGWWEREWKRWHGGDNRGLAGTYYEELMIGQS